MRVRKNAYNRSRIAEFFKEHPEEEKAPARFCCLPLNMRIRRRGRNKIQLEIK